MNKDTVIKIVLVIVCIVLCFLLFRSCTQKPENPGGNEEIIKIYEDSIISLKDSITVLNNRTEELKKKRDTIEIIKWKTIETIKTLPIDSSTKLCKENLVKYGELTTPTDSFPVVVSGEKVLFSADGVKDVNIISEKLRAAEEKNEVTENMVKLDSCKILLYESELACKDSIRSLENEQYELNLEKITNDLKQQKRETRKAKVLGWFGTFTGTTVGGVLGYIIGKEK